MQAVRTHLELRRPPSPAPPPDLAPLRLVRLDRPTAAEYRRLYAAVGAAWHWHDRDAWSDARLDVHLGAPGVAVWVLHEGEALAGYFELAPHPADAPDDGATIELVYFGLVGAQLGRGHGRRLLEAAIAEAWRAGAGRLVLNTCTLDHAAALPNYLARGFRVTREETYEVERPASAT